ncbi:angiomotin-like protein 2 isoform X2 [Cloeon dipterum]|uniref:angiomotin-like protein 2 isoform X2 n=1 Tax=Cloeon dipterum TaxID=197152 RepID=UPI0032209EE8
MLPAQAKAPAKPAAADKPTSKKTSLSGSETDVSTSTENLSQEERYVIKHTARQEPQGQEKQEPADGLAPHPGRQLSLDNASSYNTLIIHANGEEGLEPWASLSPNRLSSLRDSYISAASSHSKASLPSSSASSSPTLCGGGGLGGLQGETREINEIPADYLSKSRVLKHLAKEMKQDAKGGGGGGARRLLVLDVSPERHARLLAHRYSTPVQRSPPPAPLQGRLALSRSQPDLTQQQEQAKPRRRLELVLPESEMVQLLVNETAYLKAELEMCLRKVAKSQKLEEEVANIHRSHQELMQSSERREKLERAARQRLQEDNRLLRQQYELLLAQVERGPEASAAAEVAVLKCELAKRESALAAASAQTKELLACRERQELELAAQRATLHEQRKHMHILETALNNAQATVLRLEHECRKRQLHEQRLLHLQTSLDTQLAANDKLEAQLDALRRDKGEKGDESELRQLLREREERVLSLEKEVAQWQQWYVDESAFRQAVIEAASMPKEGKMAAAAQAALDKSQQQQQQQSERRICEDKIRQLDQLHAAQRRLADVEATAQQLESKVAEKDAMIKVLQQSMRASPHHHLHRQPSPSPIGSMMLSNASSTTLASYPRALSAARASSAGLAFQRSPSVAADYGGSSGAASTTSSSAHLVSSAAKTTAAGGGSTLGRSFSDDAHSLDEQLHTLDSQVLGGRVLCCFSGLYNRGVAARKEGLSQPLLAGVKRRPPAGIGALGGGGGGSLPPTPPPPLQGGAAPRASSLHERSDILILEKQGRASQRQRRSSAGSQSSDSASGLARPPAAPAAPASAGYHRLDRSSSKESLHSSSRLRHSACRLAHQPPNYRIQL